MNQDNNKENGFYHFDGKPFVSVTQVISVLDKPALKSWFGAVIYDAVKENPNLTKAEALKVPWQNSLQAIIRGKLVHNIVEMWEVTDQLRNDFAQYTGYIDSFANWLKDYEIKPLEHEICVRSDLHNYAGRLDLVANVNGKKCLIDIKTNEKARLFEEVQLQLSAYEQALKEAGETVEACYGLSLGEGGIYTFKEFETDIKPFLSCKDLWVWKNKSKCKKVGYLF
jgi:hypothetical protein